MPVRIRVMVRARLRNKVRIRASGRTRSREGYMYVKGEVKGRDQAPRQGFMRCWLGATIKFSVRVSARTKAGARVHVSIKG